MIKEYRKVSTIKAEQFDGSDQMIKKYEVTEHDLGEEASMPEVSGIIQYSIETLEGIMIFEINDWIVTGIDGEHWAIRDDIFRKTYVPVEPKGILYYSKKMDAHDKLVKFFSKKNLHIDSEKLASQVIDLLDEDDWNFL